MPFSLQNKHIHHQFYSTKAKYSYSQAFFRAVNTHIHKLFAPLKPHLGSGFISFPGHLCQSDFPDATVVYYAKNEKHNCQNKTTDLRKGNISSYTQSTIVILPKITLRCYIKK